MPLSGSAEVLTESGAAWTADERKALAPIARKTTTFFMFHSFNCCGPTPCIAESSRNNAIRWLGSAPTSIYLGQPHCWMFPVGTMGAADRSCRLQLEEIPDEKTFADKHCRRSRFCYRC